MIAFASIVDWCWLLFLVCLLVTIVAKITVFGYSCFFVVVAAAAGVVGVGVVSLFVGLLICWLQLSLLIIVDSCRFLLILVGSC